jgi:ribosome biogenesis ATPase
VFIDEIDSITSKRENAQREMERRIVTQLMTCMDDLSQSFQRRIEEPDNYFPHTEKPKHVLVIGATNRPEALDPALRRPGRFDREILLGVPDEDGRAQILSVLAKQLRLEGSFDFKSIARCTPGFVGADLAALTQEAGAIAIKRIISHRKLKECATKSPVMAASSLDVMESSCVAAGEVDQCVEIYDPKFSDGSDWWKIQWSQEEMCRLNITMRDFEVKSIFLLAMISC